PPQPPAAGASERGTPSEPGASATGAAYPVADAPGSDQTKPRPVVVISDEPVVAGGEHPLFGLFREEVRGNALVLYLGLRHVAQAPGDAEKLDELAHAARSIRGAARIVDVAPASDLARVIEETLASAGQQQVRLESGDIDTL